MSSEAVQEQPAPDAPMKVEQAESLPASTTDICNNLPNGQAPVEVKTENPSIEDVSQKPAPSLEAPSRFPDLSNPAPSSPAPPPPPPPPQTTTTTTDAPIENGHDDTGAGVLSAVEVEALRQHSQSHPEVSHSLGHPPQPALSHDTYPPNNAMIQKSEAPSHSAQPPIGPPIHQSTHPPQYSAAPQTAAPAPAAPLPTPSPSTQNPVQYSHPGQYASQPPAPASSTTHPSNPYPYTPPANGPPQYYGTLPPMHYALPVVDQNKMLSAGRHKKEVKRRTKTGCLTCRKRRIKVCSKLLNKHVFMLVLLVVVLVGCDKSLGKTV